MEKSLNINCENGAFNGGPNGSKQPNNTNNTNNADNGLIELCSNDFAMFPFRKTDELIPGAKYVVRYMKKVKTQYGTRIRCISDTFNYDLPSSFLVSLNVYDLDDINYGPVRLEFVGRNDDQYRTIIIKLHGMPLPTGYGNNTEYNNRPLPIRNREPKQWAISTISSVSESISSKSTESNIQSITTISTTTTNSTPIHIDLTAASEELGASSSDLSSSTMPSINISTEISTTAASTGVSTNAVNLHRYSASDFISKPTKPTRRLCGTTVKLQHRKDKNEPSTSRGNNSQFHNVCKVCYENEGQVVLLQCGHMGICLRCSKKLLRKPCPFCRQKVTKITKVYFN